MKISKAISFCVTKIIQKKRFVKDILNSILDRSGRVLLVGGAVRDLFLDLPIKDLDFEVYGLTLEQLQEVLELYGVVTMIGKSFGVLRLHGLDVDWSLPRKDSSGRHPVVAYDPNMGYEQAFARRDLTINAMGIDMQTFELIDPYHGQHDLKHKILRATDSNFFIQDPLRLLRVMQFVGRFEMRIEDDLSQLCATMDISKVSQERIEQEFNKLFLRSQRPSLGLQWLMQVGKFHEILPGVVAQDLLWTTLDDAALQKYGSDQEKIVMMWAVVISFVDIKKDDNNFQQQSYKNKQTLIDLLRRVSRCDTTVMRAVNLVMYASIVHVALTDVQLKWLAAWLAPDLSIRFLLQFVSIRYDQQRDDILLERVKNLGIVDFPQVPLLTGKDFLDVAQGAQIGLLVKKAYQVQIDENITDQYELKKIVVY